MNAPDPRLGRLLLLGEDFGEYGAIASTRIGIHAAASISVGITTESPSNNFKFDDSVKNEDALCVMEAGTWSAYAVADAHYGPESSHMLIGRLYQVLSKVRPNGPEHLAQMIEFLRQGDPAQTESESSLLVVVYDRVERSGFGISFGDSSFVLAGPGREATPLNGRDHRYVTARSRTSLRHGTPFDFTTEPGDLMLTFTDGIDECHYRSAETSVQPHHILDIADRANGDTQQVVSELTELALRGVDGNPGGEDNIALICANA